MGKRSNFERKPKDYYVTPVEALNYTFLKALRDNGTTTFIEPCAGNNALTCHLESYGLECFGSYDIEPKSPDVEKCDAFYLKASAHAIITNPPWTRRILHPMIEHFRQMNDAWLLFDADWAHTKQSAPFIPFCHMIISVGRLSWEQNGVTGKDNVAWYLFRKTAAETIFLGRQE